MGVFLCFTFFKCSLFFCFIFPIFNLQNLYSVLLLWRCFRNILSCWLCVFTFIWSWYFYWACDFFFWGTGLIPSGAQIEHLLPKRNETTLKRFVHFINYCTCGCFADWVADAYCTTHSRDCLARQMAKPLHKFRHVFFKCGWAYNLSLHNPLSGAFVPRCILNTLVVM